MGLRRGQWVVVGGKNVGIVDALGSMDGEEGGTPVANVHLVDENGETIAPVVVKLTDLAPVTVLEDIPEPRRRHLPSDYDPQGKQRTGLATAINESVVRAQTAVVEKKPGKR